MLCARSVRYQQTLRGHLGELLVTTHKTAKFKSRYWLACGSPSGGAPLGNAIYQNAPSTLSGTVALHDDVSIQKQR
jgi:hypothetical protein